MELEFSDIDKRNGWNAVFQEIRNESNNFDYIIKDAKKIQNKNLNRYRDVNPFDHSRVRLKRGEKDYINASLVNVSSANRSYILTQGPLPETTGHFWLMVWEQKSKAILMLNRVIEKNTVKCHQYWPVGSMSGGSDVLVLSDVKLKITYLSQKVESYYVIRKFLLSDLETLDSREVLQFHYTTWPDFGVPESPAAFLNFLFSVRESGVLNSNVGPPVVHCSAGIGRSGTFCLVDSCLVLIEKNNDMNSINIREQLLEMRRYRMGLIQTPDQLRFSYQAIIEGAKRVLSNDVLEIKSSFNENVPLMQIRSTTNFENMSGSEVLPPPLPPRSRNSEEFQTVSNSNYIEQNGEVCNLNSNAGQSCDLSTKFESADSPQNRANEDNNHSDPNLTKSSHSTSAESVTEVRKRARKEREEKTAALVQNIKRKQKETEIWEKRRSFIKISLGLVLIIGIGYFVYKNYSKS